MHVAFVGRISVLVGEAMAPTKAVESRAFTVFQALGVGAELAKSHVATVIGSTTLMASSYTNTWL